MNARVPAAAVRRHLAWAIAAKLLLLGVLFALCFSPSHRPRVDAGRVFDRLSPAR